MIKFCTVLRRRGDNIAAKSCVAVTSAIRAIGGPDASTPTRLALDSKRWTMPAKRALHLLVVRSERSVPQRPR
jgi:hypothetical protein